MNLLDYFLKGGIFMWPILLCSVIALGVIAERFFFFYRRKINEEDFKLKLHLAVAQGRLKDATDLTREGVNALVQISCSYLQHYDNVEREKLLSSQASLLLEKEEKHLNILAVIARIAPLIGLLGTVAGLVESFIGIESLGSQVKPSDMAGGIWAALMTTVFGLIVAIPAMVFHNYFEAKVDHHARHMEILVTDMDIWFAESIQTKAVAEIPSEAGVITGLS